MSGYTFRKVEVDDDLWRLVAIVGAQTDRSKKQVVEDALKKYLLHPAILKQEDDGCNTNR